MTDITREQALAHFGVKGMRWGVRNDKPATSGTSTKSNPLSKSKGKVGEGEELYVALVGIVLVAKASKAAMNTIDSGNAKVILNKGKRFVTRQKLDYKVDTSLAKKKMSESELMTKVVKPVNRDYPSKGTKQNCRRCTVAYEMRRRGFDVTATKSIMATGQHGLGMKKALNVNTRKYEAAENKVFTVANVRALKNTDAPDALFKALKGQPNGSRGEVAVGWLMGGGHSVAYEIINNKPVIIDTQSGKMFKNSQEWAKAYKYPAATAAYTRLDNKRLNKDWVERWVKNND